MTAPKESHDDRFSSRYTNLAGERVGTKVLYATDDFFAEKENLILPGRGVFIPDRYTDRGKWMDGWESRRKRTPGNDHCIVRLGLPGVIRGVDVDTNHFLGNHPPFASLEACELPRGRDPDEKTAWTEILPKAALAPGSQNLFEVRSDRRFTHVRLQIYPDGGVARLRVYGDVSVDWESFKKGELIDLAAVENGGLVLSCNDMFFGPKDNLIQPGRGKNMGDGWETKRKRILPGFDWVIVKLGHRGVLERIEVDTAHFKGNYPDRFSLLGVDSPGADALADPERIAWKTILPETKLEADKQHVYRKEVQDVGPVTHVKLNIYPDGGVSRLRCHGKLA